MSPIYTREGDDGYTGLLGEGRVPKYDLRPVAYGTVDEASASLGLSRAIAKSDVTAEILLQVQHDLYLMMAELAATPANVHRFRRIDDQRLKWLEARVDEVAAKVSLPEGFVLGGDSLGGASLDVARTVIRRAERYVAQLQHTGETDNPIILAYLNRLSSLCFVLSLWEYHQAGVKKLSLAQSEAE